jgi:hypothetical protein
LTSNKNLNVSVTAAVHSSEVDRARFRDHNTVRHILLLAMSVLLP